MRICILLSLLLATAGCDGVFGTLWHSETLASGSTIKVTSFNLVWGIEHDDRRIAMDCFALEYVTEKALAPATEREAEALQAFELFRPISERWAFRFAQVSAFRTLERRGRYDLYWFERQPDGSWSFTRSEAKVFATD